MAPSRSSTAAFRRTLRSEPRGAREGVVVQVGRSALLALEAGEQGAPGNAGSIGAAGTASGGGYFASPGSLSPIFDTIIAANTAITDPDITGSFSSQGHNLIGDGTGGSGFSSILGDQVGKA